MSILTFIKNWTLPIAMTTGALSYVVYTSLPCLAPTKPFVKEALDILQPVLIFTMLFLSFCKVELRDLLPRRWHLWLLLFQAAGFMLCSSVLIACPHLPGRLFVECAMLCLICPTATAGAVVAGKLGANPAPLTTYILFINLTTAVLVPLFIPMTHPGTDIVFTESLLAISAHVFPLLFFPLVLAQAVRYMLPGVHRWITQWRDLAFYLWAVALAIAIGLTVKSIANSHITAGFLLGMAAVSLLCCAIQFAFGRCIGKRYGEALIAAQSIGQKNTVFAIWLAYTFMTPATSIAGGFYSIWHNVYNSYQLRKARKEGRI